MTRWKANYDVHKSYTVYSFANLSSMYWPTLNCSKPLSQSTVTELMKDIWATYTNTSDPNKKQNIICDEFEILHMGGDDIRVTCDDIEGLANESQGFIVRSGERYNPSIRCHEFLGIYTSSNASVQIQLSVRGYA